ncbi:MAG TPA: acyltransferase, partial [Opitutaceae bacterium]|nr:acyltransferase [Opitutaceae bacterium]
NNFLKVFYLRRICRIFPLYFSWLLLCVAICKAPPSIKLHFFPPIFPSNTEFWTYFLYLQNLVGPMAHGIMPVCLAVTWSLAVEEQFYGVMPVLISMLPRKTLAVLMGLVVVSSPFIRLYFAPPFWRWDGLSLGVLLALAQRDAQIWNALKAGRGGIRFLWILTMLTAWIAPVYVSIPRAFVISLHDISWTFLVLLTITGDGLVTWLTTRTLLVKAGAISYGLYLLHLPMLYFIFWWENGVGLIDFFDWVLTALAFVLVWVVAQVSYEYFERPIVAWGHRVKYLKAASP